MPYPKGMLEVGSIPTILPSYKQKKWRLVSTLIDTSLQLTGLYYFNIKGLTFYQLHYELIN